MDLATIGQNHKTVIWHISVRPVLSQELIFRLAGRTILISEHHSFKSCSSNSYREYIRWLFRRSVVVDGNFHADHLKMKYPEDDVALADGCAFMVETLSYEEHLKESKDIKQVHFSNYFLLFYQLIDNG